MLEKRFIKSLWLKYIWGIRGWHSGGHSALGTFLAHLLYWYIIRYTSIIYYLKKLTFQHSTFGQRAFFRWEIFIRGFSGGFFLEFFSGVLFTVEFFSGGIINGHHLDNVSKFLKTPLNSFHIILTKLVIINGKKLLWLLFISSGTSCTTLQRFFWTIPYKKKGLLTEKVSLPRGKLDQISFWNHV